MALFHITPDQWADGIQNARQTYRLAGPVKNDRFYEFAFLTDDQVPDMTYDTTRLSPKQIVFPRSEVMFEFHTDTTADDAHVLKETLPDDSPVAVVGIRPCDMQGILMLKQNFDTPDIKDTYFQRRFDACTFIGLAVNTPQPSDFSTSCGTGPFDETGLDILLVDCSDYFLAKVLTDNGTEWMKTAGLSQKADANAEKKISKMKQTAEKAITSTINTDNIQNSDILTLHGADFWEEIAFGCINCGACTYACPTCWCFDIQDETFGKKGVRIRNWDTCMAGLYSVHASGHNPRGKDWERTRQRFMHKLKYFPEKYDGQLMCVGCGRCITQCPAGIDIRHVAEKMNAVK